MKNMELKDFISGSLNNIVDGIASAQQHAEQVGAKINPQNTHYAPNSDRPLVGDMNMGEFGQLIEFDIAVTVMESDQASGSLGIFAAWIGAGVKGKAEVVNNAVHRICFSVPVFLPRQKSK